MGAITKQSRFVRASDIVACDLDGGQALLDLKQSQYYRLNDTASVVWDALEAARTLDELVHAVTQEFDVSADRCRPDVEALLHSMAQTGLVDMSDEPSPQ